MLNAVVVWKQRDGGIDWRADTCDEHKEKRGESGVGAIRECA
jgi:hypothetical protein